jgi:replication-associated recombination protein RarA
MTNAKYPFFGQPTLRGSTVGKSTSIFQKAVRRGNLDLALTHAVELDQSGQGKYLWGRILVIVSEDIGPAAPPGFVGDIRALYDTWQEQKAKNNPNHPERLMLIHAVHMLVHCPKSRVIDDAIWATYAQTDLLDPEVPDYCLDMHTAEGRRMGRGIDHWFEEACKLENEADIPNPYLEIVMRGYSEDTAKLQGKEAVAQGLQGTIC